VALIRFDLAGRETERTQTMSALERWWDAGKKLLHRVGDRDTPSAPRPGPGTGHGSPPGGAPDGAPEEKRGLSGWVEDRAQRVVQQAYESHAQDLEQRAMRVMTSVYEKSADDLEDRATRALRYALRTEAKHIKDAIEHGIEVKKREVRLSLLVLVVSSLVYLVLHWVTSRPVVP
jgi:hypothetical protein